MPKEKTYKGKNRRKDDLYIERIATIAAEKAVDNTLLKMGIDPSNLKEAADNHRFVTDMRKGSDETKKIAKRGIIMAFIGGIIYIIALGFQSWIDSFKSN